MIGTHFSKNGKLLPRAEAVIPLDNLAFTYGYGVYESLKVRHKTVFFPELHVQRLRTSAHELGMTVQWDAATIRGFLDDFHAQMDEPAYNIKVLLVDTDLYMFAVRPKFISKQQYKEGVAVLTYQGERLFPNAKSLNMLMSYLAYKQAAAAGAYDALLIDTQGYVREGTRTTLFYTDGTTVYTPPVHDVLNGVTRMTLLETLEAAGIPVQERRLTKKDLLTYSLFLTSTSAKVLPVSRVDETTIEIDPLVRRVMEMYDTILSQQIKKA